MIVDEEDIKQTQKKYIEQLFFNEREDQPPIQTWPRPTIMTDAVKAAINTLREVKAPESDGIHSAFFKFLEESVKVLAGIFSNIYNTENIPKELLISEFIYYYQKKKQSKQKYQHHESQAQAVS